MTGLRARGVVLLAALWVCASAAAAQDPRPREPRPAAVPLPIAGGDTIPAAQAPRELITWTEPDSIMLELMGRADYTITRYQGDTVRFDAESRALRIQGTGAVARGNTLLVGDTLVYNDARRTILAIGDTVVLRDPDQQDADVVAYGRMSYDIDRQLARVINVTTAVEAGERWFLSSREGLFIGDRTGAGHTISYGRDGSVTSCELDAPHYHFRAREIKHIARRWIIARPAVLYIEDVPVMWLPFVFQDIRSGRRSGVLNPRFGLTDVIRTSTGYRRQIENIGYYFALSDYMDAQVALDWRSGVRGTTGDPGWTRYNGELQYNWLDRFMRGRLGTSYTRRDEGSTNLALSWSHSQDFNQRGHGITTNVNYVTNTFIQRDQSFNVYQALATIQSTVNYRNRLGPASITMGGRRTQYPGRNQVDQVLPTLSITTQPISPAPWLVWSPALRFDNSEQLRIDQPTSPFRFRYVPGPGGVIDSIPIRANSRSTTLGFDTPLQLFGFTWRNSFTVRDIEQDFPVQERYTDPTDPTQQFTRVFQRGFSTSIDWETGISLPAFSQGRWNLTPSVSILNVEPGGFWLRTHRSGGEFVSQSKRLVYGVSSTPTMFALLPGFGPFARLRHAITPSISYQYSPAAQVSDEYLDALGRQRAGYLGTLPQNRISLGFSHNLEARVRSPGDTIPGGGEKLRLLTMTVSPLTYDFERARATGNTLSGFATDAFAYTVRSDLLPGFDFSMGYSLFEGSLLSDTARFSPYRTTVNASFSIGRTQNPFTALARLFRSAVPQDTATIPAASEGGQGDEFVHARPIAGTADTRSPLVLPPRAGWTASISFSSSRSRPARGADVFEFDPGAYCLGLPLDPIQLRQCQEIERGRITDTLPTTTVGGPIFRPAPMSTVQGSFGFNLTPNWSVQWNTGYDFQRSEFSDHFVTLQRQMHDWRASFSFSQAPNGNFAFNFFISLIAQPELKFDYRQRSYRPQQ